MNSCTAVARIFAAGMLIALAGLTAAQQPYPSKPIRFIVPYSAGASNTVLARVVGQKLSESWGQQVIVDSRPGGNSFIGTEAVVKSPPDGYTLLLMALSHVIIPQLLPAPYDAIKDFAPVTTLARTESILMLHTSVPANNLQELIALAKSKPGQLNYGSGGTGTSNHLAMALLVMRTGIKMQHVPYKGAAPALIDLVGGQVQLCFTNAMSVLPYIKSGRLKAVAISGESRLSALPQVPTFTEAGLPGFDSKNWLGVLAPAGTPKEIINKLSTEISKILATPDTKDKLLSEGMEPFISTPDEVTALLKADMARYGKIIKAANIKMEN